MSARFNVRATMPRDDGEVLLCASLGNSDDAPENWIILAMSLARGEPGRMLKILITGFSGFVSRHFVAHLEANAVDVEVLGIARSAPNPPMGSFRHIRVSSHILDLLDRSAVEDAIAGFRPTHVLHLAAYSSVGFSWNRPVDSFANNTNILLNVLEQLRKLAGPCRILSVGSSEEYGIVSPASLPLTEESPLRPVSPYAVARVAQEMLSRVYAQGYGLDVIMTRSFNHIGAYQRDAFVVPSIAKQLVSIRYHGAPPRLVTGDRSVIRDFVDVRDVVRAYYALLFHGKAGETYNICSGHGVRIVDVMNMMQEQLGTAAVVETDPDLVRPSDNPVIVGSRKKITDAVGWAPSIPLRESLAIVLAWWKDKLGGL